LRGSVVLVMIFAILTPMRKIYKKSLFLFRRDLRLTDNTALLAALEQSETVIPMFLFDSRQVDRKENNYFSEPAFYFLLQSLKEIDISLQNHKSHLFVCAGDPIKILPSLITEDNVDAIFFNRDYTPFARKRDGEIIEIGERYKIAVNHFSDYALSPIETIRTGDENIYTVFTPFKKKAETFTVTQPIQNPYNNYWSKKLHTQTVNLTKFSAKIDGMTLTRKGGRQEGLEILANPLYLQDYDTRRNQTADSSGTSGLSAHHKFGTISIRESYHCAIKNSRAPGSYISELYWRDFYYYIAYHFPFVFERSFLSWAEKIEWINDEQQFAAWCTGTTGVPIVDAGMRQLNQTGFMHNRSRMIVASYLTKNLLIDWRWGERYFATKLVDYDPAQNNGGWQWSASTGADPKPIRIFNPYTQATKYDPTASYIKKWVPELKNIPDKLLTDGKTQHFHLIAANYPAPVVDQKMSFHRANQVYKKAKETYKKEQIT
jgi:deoxyribodipyrimidine photo-lyase